MSASTDFLEFEDIDQHVLTPDEMEESFHFAEVQKAKSFFDHGLTKNDIEPIVNAMVESVLENGNPLEVAEKVKIMKLIIEGFEADKRYKDYAVEEASKYGKEGRVMPSGTRIQVMNAGGGSPDFKVCGDPLVISLEKKLKERKEFLKNLPSAGIDELQEGGEVVHIYPPAKPASVETIKITLPK